MQRTRFMAEEFFRSFQKSLFKNILLMLMFSISLLMAIVMCSYYVGLGERYETTTQKVDGREWYPLDLLTESGQEVSNQLTTVGRCRDMVDYYETLKSLEEAPILSIHTSQSVGLKEEDVKKFFDEKDVLPFTDGEVNVVEVPFWDGDTYLTRDMPCLLEIAVILFPAVVIGRYVLTAAAVYYFRAGPIMQAVYIMIGAAFLVGAASLVYLMRGVDTEHLIRQKD